MNLKRKILAFSFFANYFNACIVVDYHSLTDTLHIENYNELL